MYFIMTWHNSGSSFNRFVSSSFTQSFARYIADIFPFVTVLHNVHVQPAHQQRTIEVINRKTFGCMPSYLDVSLVRWLGENTMNFLRVCRIHRTNTQSKILFLTYCINKWLNIELNYSRDDSHFKSTDSFHHSAYMLP